MKVQVVRIEKPMDYSDRIIDTHMAESEFQELVGGTIHMAMLDWTDTRDIEDYDPTEKCYVRIPPDDSDQTPVNVVPMIPASI